MKKSLLAVLFLVFIRIFSQDIPAQNQALVKDPFFNNQNPQEQSGKKVQHKHSDTFGVRADKYEGNPVFSGNVVFEQQGSVLTANEVVWYQKENFLKAIGNVVLQVLTEAELPLQKWNMMVIQNAELPEKM